LKSDDAEDKALALGTLRYVLRELSKVMAPSMPFYAEYLWSRIREEHEEESVHLASWPEEHQVDTEVIASMEATRAIVSLALELRTKANIKVRQPLSALRVKHVFAKDGEDYLALIRDEVNVKEIISDSGMHEEVRLDTEITPELKMEGDVREFIRQIQDLRKSMGLEAKDRVSLCVQTSKEGEAMISAFRPEIERVVGAIAIAFADNEGSDVQAGEHSFTVAIEKH
jgi:isoleucyl-tRNA synthetase